MIIKKVLNSIWLVLILIFFINNHIYGQKKIIIYEMGRPNALDYNIAKRIIGKEYKLVFVYAGQKMTDSLGIEYFEDLNKVSREKKARKYGDDWVSEFNNKISKEISVHHSLYTVIKKTKEYKNIKNNELYILLDRSRCCKKRYQSYIVGRFLVDKEYKMKTIFKLKINSKNNQIKRIIEKQNSLPFKFEENGIF